MAPLDRRAGGIPGGDLYPAQSFLHRFSQMKCVVGIFGGHIQILVDGIQGNIGHTKLLSLIEKRCSPLENIGGCKHSRGSPPEMKISVAADHPGMIVVLQIQGIPGHAGGPLPSGPLSLKTVFPPGESALELAQAEAVIDILCHETVRHHRIELDQHVQHTVLSRYVGKGFFYAGKRSFANLDRAVFQGRLPELLQVSVQIGTVLIKGEAVDDRHKGQTVRKPGILGDKIDDILPESVHAQVQPEAHDALYFFAHPGVIHIQIRLLARENMQVILPPLLVVLPGQSLKLAEPVVRRTILFRLILNTLSVPVSFFLPLFPLPLIHGKSGDIFQFISLFSQDLRSFFQVFFNLHTQGVAPDVIVAVGIVLSFAALNKPGVFVGGVVDDQVQQDFQSQFMGPVQHFLKLLQSSVIRMDIFVIGNVIAVIRIGRGKDRAEPDPVHPKGLYIVQLVIHSVQIPDPVSVSVTERPDPDLVKRHFPEIKLFFLHHIVRFLSASSCAVRFISLLNSFTSSRSPSAAVCISSRIQWTPVSAFCVPISIPSRIF